MSDPNHTLGLIAGGGQFPLLMARSAREMGLRVVAVAHEGETEPGLEHEVDDVVWIKLGQLGRLIRALKERSVQKCVMAGAITKRRMFERLRPDLKGLALASKLAIFHDDDILRAVASEMAKEGIEIVSPTHCLPELVAPFGCLTARKPDKTEIGDIQVGWKAAKELGRLDIGQCVVVRRRTVLAVEAIEGTDETIRRGGELAKERAVVVKVSKPHQDLRFDMPSVGMETVHVMAKVRAFALAVESQKTLIFDRPRMIEYANEMGISIIACDATKEGPLW
jgi:hypothetical protein